MAKKSSVTIQDVAKEAGVSVSTVSRVLNEKVDVAEDTRQHVLSVITELGYISNLAARSMRSQRNNLLGLVVPDLASPYSIDIMKGISRAVTESEFDLMLYTTGGIEKSVTAEHEQHYVSLLSNSIADGVLIVASAAANFVTNVPIVAVDPHYIDPEYPSVQGTNYQGAVVATEYLIELGHQRIGFICGGSETVSSGRREKGYRDSLIKAGIPINEKLIVPGDFTTETGYRRSMELLTMEEPPTAIFASNDQSALGVYQAARELGLSIPADLSVIGFDNITEAEFLGLTTVDQNLEEMGYIAAQLLVKLIDNLPVSFTTHKMPTKLIVRESCARPVQ